MFADGSRTQDKNGNLSLPYVVTSHEILEAYVLSGIKSAQAAELIVTGAAIFDSGIKMKIYICSKYVFGICHAKFF